MVMASLQMIPDDLNEIIRVKERELHDINQLRCERLEVALIEKDNTISDILKRFGALKDDFEYNLTLLDARDREIVQLEANCAQLSENIEARTQELRTAQKRLEASEILYNDLVATRNRERHETQEIILEIKEEVDSVKWIAEEEVKSKQREIVVLKSDLRRSTATREEALESQRRDLTTTFEALLQQRDETSVVKEREVAEQMSMLESKFDTIQTENMRLKSELANSRCRVDLLSEESLRREEYLRQVQWRLDAERESRSSEDRDSITRLQQTLTEALSAKENLTVHLRESQQACEKAIADCKQEQSRRLIFQRQADEFKVSSEDAIANLRSQLSVVTERENRLVTEVGSLQAKIDEMQRSRREVEERLLHTTTENSKLSTELGTLRSSISYKSTKISDLEAQVLRMKTKFSNKIQAMSETHQDQTEELSKEIERLRYEKQQLVGFDEGQGLISYDELRDEAARMKSEIQTTFASLQSTQERVQILEKQLHDERAEASALQLRLDLQRENSHPSTGMHLISQDKDFERKSTFHQRLKEVGSPQFSDDFGPVSLPGSPIEHHNRTALRRERSYSEESPRASSGNMEATLLLAENNRLKNVIRDMRGDLESLQIQLLPGTDISNAFADKKKIEILEERLKQSSDEISKLRSERRRLMDIGNEVRAELNQVKRDFAELRSTNEGFAKNVVGAVSRRSENRASGAVSFAGDGVDPWLNLPIRTDISTEKKSSQALYSDDFASSGEELEVTGNRTGTNAGKISRSVLDKGKGLKARSIAKLNAAGSSTSSTTRKVMNYARAGGDDAES